MQKNTHHPAHKNQASKNQAHKSQAKKNLANKHNTNKITNTNKMLKQQKQSGKVMTGFALLVLGFFLLVILNQDAISDTSKKQTTQNQHTINTQKLVQLKKSEALKAKKVNQQKLTKGEKANYIFVKKSIRRMYLYHITKKNNKTHKKLLRSYHIALGESPKGHKKQEGDEKTPEGIYTLDYKKEDSIAHRSIHISYPNAKDKAQAQKRGVSPGGFIMIHGLMNSMGKLPQPIQEKIQQRDWTDGCIAVTNKEMDEIMDLVPVNTKIEIRW